MGPDVLGVIAIALIVVAAVVARKTGMASVLILLLMGIGIGYLPGVPEVGINPEWVLAGILPLLLYSAAVKVPMTDFRRNLRAITGLSVTLVVVTSALCGLVLYALIPALGLPTAIALGAVVSPTDAVAATSIARRLGLPGRLVTVLEGESLVNDASALVLLRSALAAAAGAVSLLSIAADFVYAVVVAIGIGLVVGFVSVAIRARLSEPVVTTTISFAIPFIAFLPAERLGASGVLAVVVAGLVTGHRGARRFAASQRINDHTNWNTVQFILEHGVFLVMGLELRGLIDEVSRESGGLPSAVLIGLLLTATVIAIRFAFVIPQLALLRSWERKGIEIAGGRLDGVQQRLDATTPTTSREKRRTSMVRRRLVRSSADNDFYQKQGLSWRGSVVISWAGMRGVVTLAAAQSLPADTPFRATLILVAFTVALTTLVALGGSLPWVIRATKISGDGGEARREEIRSLLDAVNQAAVAMLDDREKTTVDGRPADPSLVEALRARYTRPERIELTDGESGAIDARSQYFIIDQRMRETARDELLDAHAAGLYSSDAITAVQRILDIEDSKFEN
ncbi:cation:proton antiporter [Luethyella okanaganae]|uniref:Cation:proton antiporter n=1 Tax=Luethyella okanaganae TaxID=69372 RepID=A0ABW1VBZ2_9MICO